MGMKIIDAKKLPCVKRKQMVAFTEKLDKLTTKSILLKVGDGFKPRKFRKESVVVAILPPHSIYTGVKKRPDSSFEIPWFRQEFFGYKFIVKI